MTVTGEPENGGTVASSLDAVAGLMGGGTLVVLFVAPVSCDRGGGSCTAVLDDCCEGAGSAALEVVAPGSASVLALVGAEGGAIALLEGAAGDSSSGSASACVAVGVARWLQAGDLA